MEQDFQVSAEDLGYYLGKLPLCKAVPKHIAPAAVWRLCSASVVQVMSTAQCRIWRAENTANVPQPWIDTCLVCLSKPNKDPHQPSGSRPIGLSHPLSKSMNRLLRDQLKPYLDPKLACVPQYTYTAGRGVLDALLRVHHHVRKARQILLKSKATIYPQHQGEKSKPCAGGLCFSLHLEGAFDSVPRALCWRIA